MPGPAAMCNRGRDQQTQPVAAMGREELHQLGLFDGAPHDAEIYEKLKAIPKADLHRHLTACFRPTTLLCAARAQGILNTLTKSKLRERLLLTGRAKDVNAFIDKPWRLINRVLRGVDVQRFFAQAVLEAIEDAAQDNVHYLELRTSPYYLMAPDGYLNVEKCALFFRGLMDGIERARRAHAEVTAQFIVTIPRHTWSMTNRAIRLRYFEELLDLCRKYGPAICGFDLAGKENGYPPELFGDFFAQVKRLGYKTTVHAGESDEPRRIAEAVHTLHADRIGHGITAVQDPGVVGLLRERQIPLEICLTSNYRTSSVRSIAEHPAKLLYEEGVPITINTDDPQFLSPVVGPARALRLTDELYNLASALRFSLAHVLDVARNGFRFAFLDAGVRAVFEEEFAQAVRAFT